LHNHSRRKDVTHSEILLPGHLAGENMDWALNRASLWNSVESAEVRKNARVATEIQVTLPFELPPQGRLAMARTFSQEVADHYKVAVDLAVHDPRPSGDPRNFHAHLLLTTREVSGAGLGPKTGLDMPASERVRLGLPNISQEFTAIRERWATLTNEALKQANIGARVDHRSLAEQGIDREPKPHIPFAAYKIERAGKHSEVAESIRADYNARVQERLERAAERTPERTPERLEGARAAPKSLEDIRREARENWLRMRADENSKPASPSKEAQTGNAAAPPTHSTGAQSRGADGLTHITAGRTHNSPATDDDYQP
jgi:ATP-dependent exoDNAse (exonuclease V) alpha subunit